MLSHPVLDQLRTLRLEGMAKALEEQFQMAGNGGGVPGAVDGLGPLKKRSSTRELGLTFGWAPCLWGLLRRIEMFPKCSPKTIPGHAKRPG